jgi:uncharacterized membrane protein YdjX (TVP38/TMEM64 family)
LSGGSEFSSDAWGWVLALAATTWGVVLRVIVGRYMAASKAEKELKARIEARLTAIEGRLTVIEGRSYRRRQGD